MLDAIKIICDRESVILRADTTCLIVAKRGTWASSQWCGEHPIHHPSIHTVEPLCAPTPIESILPFNIRL